MENEFERKPVNYAFNNFISTRAPKYSRKQFHSSIENLLETDDVSKRVSYLNNIYYKLSRTDPEEFELFYFNFFIDQFLISPTLLADERFNNEEMAMLIIKIQVVLVHIFFPDQISDFFDQDSESFLFSWNKTHIYEFLTSFNDSMKQSFAMADFNLREFEKKLFGMNIEQLLIDYLLQSYESDKSDSRPLQILADSLFWFNPQLIFNERIIQNSIESLNLSTDFEHPVLYDVIYSLTQRCRPDEDEHIDPRTEEIRNRLISLFTASNILEVFYNHIQTHNAIHFGQELYRLINHTCFVCESFIEPLIDFNLHVLGIPIYDHPSTPQCFRRISSAKEPMINIEAVFDKVVQASSAVLQNESSQSNFLALINYLSIILLLNPNGIEQFLHQINVDSSSTACYITMKACQQCLSSKIPLLFQFLTYFVFIFKYSGTEPFYIDIFTIYFNMYIQGITYSSLEQTIQQRKAIIQPLFEWSLSIPNQEVYELFKNQIICSALFAKQLREMNVADFIIKTYVQVMNSQLIELALIIFKHCDNPRFERQKSDIRAYLIDLVSDTEIDNQNAIPLLMISLMADYQSNTLLIDTFQKVLQCDQSVLEETIRFIPYIIQSLQFKSCDLIFDLAFEHLNYEIILNITKCKTDQYNHQQYDQLPENVMKFADLIFIYLRQNMDEPSKELYSIISNAVSFFSPVIDFIPPENLMFFTQLLSNCINEGIIDHQIFHTFVSSIISQQTDVFNEIRWFLFDQTKHTILHFDYSKNRAAIDLSTELISYQFLMFTVDAEKANELFNQPSENVLPMHFKQYLKLLTTQYHSESEKKEAIQTLLNRLKHHKPRLLKIGEDVRLE